MPVVLISPEALFGQPGSHVDHLTSAGFQVRYPRQPEFSKGLLGPRETIAELSGCQAVLAGVELFTSEVLEGLPELRVIARTGVGFDRIDIAAATCRGVVVTITPRANYEAVAEQTFALLLAIAKSIVPRHLEVCAARWRRLKTKPLRTSTLGIVGLGRIGRAVAARACAFGMQVLATEPDPPWDFVHRHGVQLVDLPELLARSDYVTLHCPLTRETRGLIHAGTLRLMKPGAGLINTARGPLIVESDLVESLRSGHLGAVGLDVLEREPVQFDNPLVRLDNVVLSPHIAGMDDLSLQQMADDAARSVVQLFRGYWPDEGVVVNSELCGQWSWS